MIIIFLICSLVLKQIINNLKRKANCIFKDHSNPIHFRYKLKCALAKEKYYTSQFCILIFNLKHRVSKRLHINDRTDTLQDLCMFGLTITKQLLFV